MLPPKPEKNIKEYSPDHHPENYPETKKEFKKVLFWSIGLWLICSLIYGLIAYLQSSPSPNSFDGYREIFKTALGKNGYSVLKNDDNHVQFKKKEWTGTYYVDISTRIARPTQLQRFKCKISFYPKNREKRPDRWKFVWETLLENPKFVGVLNFIAKTFTENQLTGRDIQIGIEQKLKDEDPKTDLILTSKNGKYSFRIRPYPSKVVCEFTGLTQ